MRVHPVFVGGPADGLNVPTPDKRPYWDFLKEVIYRYTGQTYCTENDTYLVYVWDSFSAEDALTAVHNAVRQYS